MSSIICPRPPCPPDCLLSSCWCSPGCYDLRSTSRSSSEAWEGDSIPTFEPRCGYICVKLTPDQAQHISNKQQTTTNTDTTNTTITTASTTAITTTATTADTAPSRSQSTSCECCVDSDWTSTRVDTQQTLPTSSPDMLSTPSPASQAATAINILLSSPSALATLADHAIAYVNVHGMCLMTSALHHHTTTSTEHVQGQHDHQVTHLPVSLLPTPLSRTGFELTWRVAPLFNTLMDKIARDAVFLNTSLASIVAVDPFQRRLLDIYNTVHEEGTSMDLTLSINRADYMFDGTDMSHARPLQVEVNTISAGLITLGQRVREMHGFMIDRHVTNMIQDDISTVNMPDNHSFDGLIDAMKLTVDTYKTSYMSLINKPKLAIMMVVQPVEFNVSDQRQIEYALWDRHGIPVFRRTLSQIHGMSLTSDRHLIIDGYTIALVYFRSGYDPSCFPTEHEWDALVMLERAVTVKCPDVGHHLAGMKKIQQVLAQPDVVERFLPPADATLVRSTYTGLYSLDDDYDTTHAVIRDAMSHPDKYVLKPQRNGGGNNFFGHHIRDILSTATCQQRSQYILMQRIHPVIQQAATIRQGHVQVTPCSSELGIFAAHLGGSSSSSILLNRALGYLLRTKKSESDEGGVASGNAVVDSPILI